MAWQIIDYQNRTGQENMDIDRGLFQDYSKKPLKKIFRVYGWSKPCISVGYFQNINNVEAKDGWDIVKRPTGGGICYHTTDEISYSVVAAKDDIQVGGTLMESYYKISEIIMRALRSLGVNPTLNMSAPEPNRSGSGSICFDQAREYEIILNGRKIVGSAQRKGRVGFLQQGTIMTNQTGIDRNLIINSLLGSLVP